MQKIKLSVEDVIRYENYMRQLYPNKYIGKHFDYEKGKWCKNSKPKTVYNISIPKVRKNRSKRIQFKKITRQEVLKRDFFNCRNCGSKKQLHIHHIIPVAQGGKNILENLITLCKKCHAEKHQEENVYKLLII